MNPLQLGVMVVGLVVLFFWLGRWRARQLGMASGGMRYLHARPGYYGLMTAFWVGLPALILCILWWWLEDRIIARAVLSVLADSYGPIREDQQALLITRLQLMNAGRLPMADSAALQQASAHLAELTQRSVRGRQALVLALAVLAGAVAWWRIRPAQAANSQFERVLDAVLLVCTSLAVLTTAGIVLSVLLESLTFFQSVSPVAFLFGTQWSPQLAIRPDQIGASGAFGAVPLFAGTVLIAVIALLVAIPIGLMSAIYLSEYARPEMRDVLKPLLEVLAGIPTVVYGFFAALTMGPAVRAVFAGIGFDGVSPQSALAVGLVLGVMIIPFIASLSDDALRAVPVSLRDAAEGLGATRGETIRTVVLPASLPGIMGGILLATSRAIGETMIVLMAAGLAANLTANPLASVTTVTVQIATLLIGDQAFDSPKTLAAFALGLLLFITTLLLNLVALLVVRRYRERYE
ncbi:MAG: phosphate ABC transporter permease subunit PstC [Saccharospirillum sp.]